MKVALIHDHLAQDGGAERVLKVFAEMFPDAPIYTLLYDPKNAEQYYKGRRIETSIIQRLPGGVKHYKWYLPLMPMAVEFFDLSDYDLVISDASAFAKGVITSTKTKHICYCHTPTRFLWSDTHQYIAELKYNKYFKKIIALSLNKIRLWDAQAANRPDVLIANSKFIAKRIEKYYRRPSRVVYPPVDVVKFKISNAPKEYFLAGGRLAPYKRFDLIIEAFNQLQNKQKNGLPYRLKIFGDGVDLERLKNMAVGNNNIEFIGRVSDDYLATLYSNCIAFINPQEEDFGITMVEAQASGRPVIAYAGGGALEIIIAQETGLFFKNQTVDDLRCVLEEFNENQFLPEKIRENAMRFSKERFIKEMMGVVKRE